MARIRTIKPEFWSDPDVVSCSFEARLFFIGCWNHADDYGVLKDEPERLRLQVMPADDVDAELIVYQLVEKNLLVKMVTPGGVPVLVVRTFQQHQKVDQRSAARYGDPSTFTKVPAESPQLPTTEGKGREGISKGSENPSCSTSVERVNGASTGRVPAEILSDFDVFWQVYPRREGKKAAARAYASAIRSGVPPDVILAGAARYRDLPGREQKYTKHPTTWLNQGCWDDELVPRTEGTVTDRNRAAMVDHLNGPRETLRDRIAAARALPSQPPQQQLGDPA